MIQQPQSQPHPKSNKDKSTMKRPTTKEVQTKPMRSHDRCHHHHIYDMYLSRDLFYAPHYDGGKCNFGATAAFIS